MQIRIAGTIPESIVDGPGIRYVIFAQGCEHQCPGCHNPHTHPLNGGELVTTEHLLSDIQSRKLLKGVTFSGGEPFLQASAFAELGFQLRKKGLHVVTYTGYLYEEILEISLINSSFRDLLAVSNWLIDGPFRSGLRDFNLSYRGSANQRIIDVSASLQLGCTQTLEIA